VYTIFTTNFTILFFQLIEKILTFLFLMYPTTTAMITTLVARAPRTPIDSVVRPPLSSSLHHSVEDFSQCGRLSIKPHGTRGGDHKLKRVILLCDTRKRITPFFDLHLPRRPCVLLSGILLPRIFFPVPLDDFFLVSMTSSSHIFFPNDSTLFNPTSYSLTAPSPTTRPAPLQPMTNKLL
jgi:hypothetical protein